MLFTKTFLTGIWVVAMVVPAVATRGAELATIRLEEHLGAHFVPQVLHWVVELPRGKLKDAARCGLKDDRGAPVLAQVKAMDTWDDGSLRHIKVSLISGLEPYEVKRFVVDDSGQKGSDDGTFKIATEGNSVVLSSSLAAVRIPSASSADAQMPAQKAPPPISQIRGKTRWYGRGSMDSIQMIRQRQMSIADDGPIYKKAADGISFRGTAGCYSRQAEGAYYMLDRNSELATAELTVKCNAPIEFWRSRRHIKGYSQSLGAPAIVAIAGLKGVAALSVTAARTSRTVAVKDGRAQIVLPVGETEFEVMEK
jgi:hypothetical protein